MVCGVFFLVFVEELDMFFFCVGEFSFRGDVFEVKDNVEEVRDFVEVE